MKKQNTKLEQRDKGVTKSNRAMQGILCVPLQTFALCILHLKYYHVYFICYHIQELYK